MRTAFPRVTVKLGASLDGRTAMASGESQWITSPDARRDVQRLRARHDAVLSSAETVLADGASLTVRWDELPPSVKAAYPKETLRQPLRVIVDSQNRLTPDLPLFQSESPVLLARHKASGEWPEWVQQLELPLLDGKLDLVSPLCCWLNGRSTRCWLKRGHGCAARCWIKDWWMSWCSTRRQN